MPARSEGQRVSCLFAATVALVAIVLAVTLPKGAAAASDPVIAAAAGPVGKGYYSYDIGSWHLIALNSNCGSVGCGPGSPQATWLRSDLASHPNTCTLAYWHHPHFSSGPHGDGGETATLWSVL